jgi:hypothetical protein
MPKMAFDPQRENRVFVEHVKSSGLRNLRHSSPGVMLKSAQPKSILKSAGKFSKINATPVSVMKSIF